MRKAEIAPERGRRSPGGVKKARILINGHLGRCYVKGVYPNAMDRRLDIVTGVGPHREPASRDMNSQWVGDGTHGGLWGHLSYDVSVGLRAERMKFDWTQGALAEGLRLYQEGEYFAAHETWESVWRESLQPEKMFMQGLIQVTAAFHHLQRNNPLGTALLLKAALARLERYPEHFGGVSVDVLCDDIREWLQALDAGTPTLQLTSARICVDRSS